LKIRGCICGDLVWEWRPKSSFCPPGFIILTCDFRSSLELCFRSYFVSIFVLGHDLIFLEFGSISGDDFLGIGSWQGEFHLGKV
jgi:hypothetical protein